MKKIVIAIIMLFSFLSPFKVQCTSADIYARSYVVMEKFSGKVLEGKDVNLKRSVASISKIMTAIIALESDELFNAVVVGDEIDGIVGSSLYLDKGTQINLIDLVYGLMLRSGNDAAMIIAKNVGNTIEHFVELMNDKAEKIGMRNTNFINPHGLDIDDEGNISTTHDMALLMRYCLSNDLFREIAGCKQYRSPQKGIWVNKHKLIQNYEYATGGKTGYTTKARRTLITSAKKDNCELIVVTFDCGGDFAFHRSIFEKYFKDYVGLQFLQKGMNYIHGYEINADEEVVLMIHKDDLKGGTMVYKLNIDRNILVMSFVKRDNSVIEVKSIKVRSFASEGVK